ncbi:glycosyltransferase domain-containing protein [Tenacibaculum sp. SSH1-16]|uniref:glycosyltransferase domain-containing protein n=1 Tax=Tenacibaculum sp. SSH1-16 TaxID=3136667 RepID=UPI0032C3E9C5|nr:hypothetical protein BACT7_15580 [Tenacibaculum mesophilum]
MKGKLIIYTAIFGDYDDLIEPKKHYENCDFICFTDQEYLKSSVWDVKLITDSDLKPNMMNRKYKILPHEFFPNYDYSLYIDANVAVTENPYDLLEKYMKQNMIFVPHHPKRNCLYQEAKACVASGKANVFDVRKQINKYRLKNFPKEYGLGENNIILRRHNESKVIKVMSDWWQEMNKETQRDQLSFAYVLWKNNLKFTFMDESSKNNSEYFDYTLHKGASSRFYMWKNKFLIILRRLTITNLV